MVNAEEQSRIEYLTMLYELSITEHATPNKSIEEILEAKAVELGYTEAEAKKDVRNVLNTRDAVRIVIQRAVLSKSW